MPLLKEKDKASVQQHGNRASTAQQRHVQRSMTPQPNAGRERAMQGQDENRRKSHGPIQAKESNPPPSREEAAALKLPVADSRPKSKLSQSITTNAGHRPPAAQHSLYAPQVPPPDEEINV